MFPTVLYVAKKTCSIVYENFMMRVETQIRVAQRERAREKKYQTITGGVGTNNEDNTEGTA